MIKVMIGAALTCVCLAAQAPRPCSVLTAADASAIFGVPAIQTRDRSGCGWEDAAHKRSLSIAIYKVAAMFEGARQGYSKEGTVHDEGGLGGPAFSAARPTWGTGEIELYCLKQSIVLMLHLEAVDAASRLPQLRAVMRKLDPKP